MKFGFSTLKPMVLLTLPISDRTLVMINDLEVDISKYIESNETASILWIHYDTSNYDSVFRFHSCLSSNPSVVAGMSSSLVWWPVVLCCFLTVSGGLARLTEEEVQPVPAQDALGLLAPLQQVLSTKLYYLLTSR